MLVNLWLCECGRSRASQLWGGAKRSPQAGSSLWKGDEHASLLVWSVGRPSDTFEGLGDQGLPVIWVEPASPS